MTWYVAARLAGTPEVWREITHMGKPIEFASESEADHWMRARFPCTLQGVPHRCDAFHGIQPLRVVQS